MKKRNRFLYTGLLALLSMNSQAQKDSSSFLFNAIKSEQDPADKEALALRLEKNAGEEQQQQMLVNFGRMYVAEAWADAGNATKAKEWMYKMKDSAYQETTLLAIAGGLAEAKKYDEAEALLKPYIHRTQPAAEAQQQMAFVSRPSTRDFGLTYGVVLFKKGKFKEALPWLAPLEADTASGNTRSHYSRAHAEQYTLALMEAGELQKAITFSCKVLAMRGKNSEEFTKGLAQLYQKVYGNKQRYGQVMDSLAAAEKQHLLDRVVKMRVNTPAPAFRMTNVNGKEVSLESLMGKTVILDFWATWCIPCVGSFPGMQKAVDYYKNDTSVVFLFIHTSEKTATATEDAKKLLAKKQYTFDLYMDLQDTATHKHPVASAFSITALPTKFIIDKNGIIRFKNMGFVAEDEAVEEIRMMVELSNKG